MDPRQAEITARTIATAAENYDDCAVVKLMDEVAQSSSFEERRYLLHMVTQINKQDRRINPSLPELTVDVTSERARPVIELALRAPSKSMNESLGKLVPHRGGHFVYFEEMDFGSLVRTRSDCRKS